MKKQNILKKNLDFQSVINKKKQVINKFLILYWDEWSNFEIGISTPKKFAGAIKRNLIKRQIKWILDNFVNYQQNKCRVVLIVRKDFLNLSIEEKKQQVIKIFKKLNQDS